MKKISSAVIGFIVAPLIASIILTTGRGAQGEAMFVVEFGLLPIVYYFVALLTLTVAVPAYILLSMCGMVNLWSTIISGMALGALGIVLFRLPGIPGIHDFIVMVPAGALSAFGFWLIWRKGR